MSDRRVSFPPIWLRHRPRNFHEPGLGPRVPYGLVNFEKREEGFDRGRDEGEEVGLGNDGL